MRSTIMPRVAALTTSLLLILTVSSVDGHGYLSFSQSRNIVAYQDRKSWTNNHGISSKEHCPHCLNRNKGACIMTFNRDYKSPHNALGEPMHVNIQGTYTKVDIIELEVVLTEHHM